LIDACTSRTFSRIGHDHEFLAAIGMNRTIQLGK